MSAGKSSHKICINSARTSPIHSASCKFSVFIFFGFVGVVASMLLPIKNLVDVVDDVVVVDADPGFKFFDVDGP